MESPRSSMESPITRRRLLVGGASGIVTTLAGCTSMTPFVGQRLTSDFTVTPNEAETLSVHGDVGSITLRGEDRADVAVDVVKQSSSLETDLEELDVDATIRDGTLEISAEYMAELGWMESTPTADLDISIPETLAVERVESSVGQITIEHVRGEMDVVTSTGTIDVRNIEGDVSARSTTGRIAIESVAGAVSANATTGRVEIRDVGETGDVRTSTGRVDVEIQAIRGETRISTQTGRIEAAVAEDIDASIWARTSTGRISHDDIELHDVTSGSNDLRGDLGDGGPSLEFETSTGRITLTSLP